MAQSKVWLDFIQALFVAGVWPIVILTIFLMARSPLLALIGALAHKLRSLQSASAGGVELAFAIANLDPMKAKTHEIKLVATEDEQSLIQLRPVSRLTTLDPPSAE